MFDKKIIFIFFLIIFSLKFFDAVVANSGVLKNLCYAFMGIAVMISVPHFFKSKGGFILPIQILCVSILFSIFMAKFSWGQELSYAATTIPYLIWFTFFYLLYAKVPISKIENIVLIYGVIYMLLFLFQFTHTSVVYFGQHAEFVEDRGVVRVGFPGAGVFFLSCFIAVNKVTNLKTNMKYLWLAYAIIGLVINILQVTRQAIFLMLIVYLFHFLSSIKLVYKVVTVAIFVIAAYAFFNIETPISKGLVEQQKQDVSAGGDYIRIRAADYFLTQFTPTDLGKVFGNGLYNNNSSYGKTVVALSDNYGFFLSDIGLVELYILFGIFAVIAYIMIFYKSFTIPLPKDYYYLKYYLWLLLVTCLTSDSIISTNFLITTVIVLYCYQYLYEIGKISRSHVAQISAINQ